MVKIWIIIQVKKGIIDDPEIFFSENSAIERRDVLMEDFNKDYDEIEIFEKQLFLGASIS